MKSLKNCLEKKKVMEVACNVQECRYNGGKFCSKAILIMYGGICGELVDKNGNRKNPTTWMKTQEQAHTDANNQTDENVR